MLPRKKKVLDEEQKWGQREDVCKRERERERMTKGRTGGEVEKRGRRKSGEPEGEEGNICYGNRKI